MAITADLSAYLEEAYEDTSLAFPDAVYRLYLVLLAGAHLDEDDRLVLIAVEYDSQVDCLLALVDIDVYEAIAAGGCAAHR